MNSMRFIDNRIGDSGVTMLSETLKFNSALRKLDLCCYEQFDGEERLSWNEK